MRKIENIWRELEQERLGDLDVSYKRYSPAVMSDLFIAYSAPLKERGIAFLVKKINVPNIRQWSILRKFKVEILPDKANPKNVFILAKLLDPQFSDLFAILCEDLVFKVFNTLDELKLIQILCERFTKWKTIFQSIALNGLSEELQEKLYGDLYFLRKLLQKKQKLVFSVDSWLAPVGSPHDFKHGDWSVEVKTTQEYENKNIQISSENQLDTSVVPNIYIVLLSMDVAMNVGESLFDLVKSIRDLLSPKQMAINSFEKLLHEVGYFDVHAEVYQSMGYNVRNFKVYSVDEDFPRIMAKQLAKGVRDVGYSIDASICERYAIEEFTFFQEIRI